MQRFILVLVLSASFLLLAEQTLHACPSCRDAVIESAPQEEENPYQLGMAYNRSIYLMLAVPFSMVAFMGFMVYRQIRYLAVIQEAKLRDMPHSPSPLSTSAGDRACSRTSPDVDS